MKTLSLLLFTLLPLTGHAELNVIADLGGEDAAPYFEAVNKQPGMPGVSDVQPSRQPDHGVPLADGMAGMLPVNTPELSPGNTADRPLQLPGIGALFLIGDDALSREWLKANAGALAEQHAAGMMSQRHRHGYRARAARTGTRCQPGPGFRQRAGPSPAD